MGSLMVFGYEDIPEGMLVDVTFKLIGVLALIGEFDLGGSEYTVRIPEPNEDMSTGKIVGYPTKTYRYAENKYYVVLDEEKMTERDFANLRMYFEFKRD